MNRAIHYWTECIVLFLAAWQLIITTATAVPVPWRLVRDSDTRRDQQGQTDELFPIRDRLVLVAQCTSSANNAASRVLITGDRAMALCRPAGYIFSSTSSPTKKRDPTYWGRLN